MVVMEGGTQEHCGKESRNERRDIEFIRRAVRELTMQSGSDKRFLLKGWLLSTLVSECWPA